MRITGRARRDGRHLGAGLPDRPGGGLHGAHGSDQRLAEILRGCPLLKQATAQFHRAPSRGRGTRRCPNLQQRSRGSVLPLKETARSCGFLRTRRTRTGPLLQIWTRLSDSGRDGRGLGPVQTVLTEQRPLWRSVGGGAAIIPTDGCIDFIVRSEQVLLCGPQTRIIHAPADNVHPTIGLSLEAGTARRILPITLNELRDRVV